MSSAITKRILWKEYRTQRGLWGALLLCTVLFQLLIVGLTEDPKAATQVAYAIGVMLTFCYAAGCGAISFASEREEGTQLRLQALACPPVRTVTLKLGFTLFATAVMVGLGLITAWLLTGTSIIRIASLVTQDPDAQQELMGLGWVLFIYGAILLWTMFFSLLTRTVLSAIGLGAIGAFCFAWFVAALLHEFPMQYYGQLKNSTGELVALAGVLGLCLSVVVVANYVLASRWFRRHSSDTPKVKRFALLRRMKIRMSTGDGSFVVKVDTELSHADEILSPGEAATQPCPRAGLSWLYLAWGSLTWRTLRFLRWRETHESRWRFILFFGVCLLVTQAFAHQIQRAIDLSEQFPGQYSNYHINQFDNPLLALVLLAFATGCGIMSFRQEHAGEQFRVLRDRGVSAWHLWLSKHIVWGTRAVLGTAVLIMAAGLATSHFANGARWLMSFTFGFHSDASRIGDLPMPILIWRAILGTLLFYSAGQVASLICKRSVIAFFVGVMLMTFLIAAAAFSQQFGIPLGWSLLPLVPGALMLTLLRCRCWMLDQTGPRSWMPSAIVVSVAGLLCFTQSCLHRMWEYPAVDPQSIYAEAYPLTLGEQTFESLDAELAPFLARQNPSEAARETAEMYRKASSLLRPVVGSSTSSVTPDFSQPVAFADFSDGQQQWLKAEAAALELTLKAAARDECSFWTSESLSRQRFPEFIREQAALVVVSALQLEAEGKVEESLDRFRLALSISRHYGSDGGAFSFSESRKIATSVYAQLRQWADNSLVTPELAQRAVAMIREHQRSLGSLTVMNVVEHRAIRSWLADVDAYSAEALSVEAGIVFRILHSLPGEQERERRILNLLESRLAKEYFEHRRILASGSRGGHSSTTHNEAGMALPIDDETFDQFLLTTPQIRVLYPDLRFGPRDAAFECEQAARATELAIRMLASSRKNATPLNPEGQPARCRVDVWNGQELTWYPNGIRSSFRTGETVIPAGRPFLWSGGAAQAELVESSQQEVAVWHERVATAEDRARGARLDELVMNDDGEGPSRIREPAEFRTVYSYTVRGRVPGEIPAPHVYLFPKRLPATETSSSAVTGQSLPGTK